MREVWRDIRESRGAVSAMLGADPFYHSAIVCVLWAAF